MPMAATKGTKKSSKPGTMKDAPPYMKGGKKSSKKVNAVGTKKKKASKK